LSPEKCRVVDRRISLKTMQRGKPRVCKRQLLQEVWGQGHTDANHYLRMYMGQLRHKLEADPARPRYLVTEPGVGYRLKTD
jgi:two-component system KDP operon response regulator KdpE